MKWINDLIGRVLLPPLTNTLTGLFASEIPRIEQAVKDKVAEEIPKIAKAVVAAFAESSKQIIPGPVDDKIIDDVTKVIGGLLDGILAGA